MCGISSAGGREGGGGGGLELGLQQGDQRPVNCPRTPLNREGW